MGCLTIAQPATLTPASQQPFVDVGDKLPNVPLIGLNGIDQSLYAFNGQPLIINVWASWCGPCRAEMASLERLAWMEGLGEFAIIGVSTDDSKRSALALLDHTNATIPHFIDQRQRLERMLGASRIPLTVFVNADGVVIRKITGAREWDASEQTAMVAQFVQ